MQRPRLEIRFRSRKSDRRLVAPAVRGRPGPRLRLRISDGARLELAACAHGFDLATPFEKLPRNTQNLILYGNPPSNGGDEEQRPQRRQRAKAARGSNFPGLHFRVFSGTAISRNPIPTAIANGSRNTCRPRLRGVRRRRLRPESLAVKVGGLLHRRFHRARHSARRAPPWIKSATTSPRGSATSPAARSTEISERLDFLLAVGLGYLSLDRSAATLSGGEAQRIRLATQIGSRLRGVLYVLDEPSIGLHARDNGRLLIFARTTARSGQHRPRRRAR